MSREIICLECGDKLGPLHPEDRAMGWHRRIVHIDQLKLPAGHGLTINGEFKPLAQIICDRCGKPIPQGSPVKAVTMWREGRPIADWEHEYTLTDPKL